MVKEWFGNVLINSSLQITESSVEEANSVEFLLYFPRVCIPCWMKLKPTSLFDQNLPPILFSGRANVYLWELSSLLMFATCHIRLINEIDIPLHGGEQEISRQLPWAGPNWTNQNHSILRPPDVDFNRFRDNEYDGLRCCEASMWIKLMARIRYPSQSSKTRCILVHVARNLLYTIEICVYPITT